MGVLEALVALCFLIFFHELGHFSVARLFGVKVETFSIGFGPKILKKHIGNTQYALSLIPLGGYVKLKGQNDLNPLEKIQAEDSYSSKPTIQKIVILLAGPIFNFLLAFLLYIAIGASGVKVLLPVIGEVANGSPAAIAGIKPNDTVLSINNKPINAFEELNKAILESSGALSFNIKRKDEKLNISVTPSIKTSKNIFNEDIERPMIGISAKGDVGVIYMRDLSLLSYAFMQTIGAAKLIFLSIQKLISGVIPLEQLGGVVGIVNVMADIAPSGFSAFFMLVALISVNLGVLNLLPIPALDGGQILFCAYEGITNKPLNERVLYGLSTFGWALLLFLMALGLYNDIARIAAR